MRKVVWGLALFLLFVLPLAAAQGIKIEEYRIDGTMEVQVDGFGNAHVVELWKFTPNLYLQMKGTYPTTYMLKREFENRRSDVEYRGMKIKWDDSNNRIKATYTMLGAAVNHGSYWELDLGEKDVTLSNRNGNNIVLTAAQPILNGQGLLMETARVILPEDAKNIKVENGVIKYELPYKAGKKNPSFLILTGIGVVGLVLLNIPLKRGG